MTKKILFFSRGKGYGHAIPDMAIAAEILAAQSSYSIQFASYATGLLAFRQSGWECCDLGLPEANPYVATLLKSRDLIEYFAPDVVIAHEEFAAIVAARLQNVPSIFISAWLPGQSGISADSLRYADSIILLGDPGIFPPIIGAAPLRYSPPIIRKMQYTRSDRVTLRASRNISADACVIAVVPGGSASEKKCSILELVLDAFAKVDFEEKWLFWVSDSDYDAVYERTKQILGVRAMRFCHPVERILAMCDAIITRGTRGITLDATAVGVPTISLSLGDNPIDELLVPRIRSNISLNVNAVNGETLHHYVKDAISRARADDLPPANRSVEAAAAIIMEEVSRIYLQKRDLESVS